MALLCGAAWVVARTASDRYGWSQPVSWIPTPLLAAPIWIAFAGAALRERGRRLVLRERRAGVPLRSIGSAARGVALAVLALLTAWHLVFIELGMHRAATPAPEITGSLRVVFWNQAGRDLGDIAPHLMPQEPDVLVLANSHSGTPSGALAEALGAGGPVDVAQGWPFDCFSRLPVRRWGSVSLGLDGRSRGGEGSTREDSGWAAFYEVETERGPLTIWAIDLPSDPSLARLPLAREAGSAVRGWRGVARVRGPDGGRRSERSERAGFPEPDIVVGDFNIPRGSASMREFFRAAGAPGLRNAFDEAGWGWERTWPRRGPVWAIDHCFVGGRVRAVSFGAIDPGVGGHRAVVVDLVRR